MNALILVDLQNDFLPGGPLGVPAGDEVIAVANRVQPRFDCVAATQDWHPADHGSFAANHPGRVPGDVVELCGVEQVLWPVHCVQDTPGAAFADGLDARRLAHVVRKGTDSAIDSYSGFFDNGRQRATGLDAFLRERGVDALAILGLATDYCVRATVLDACELDYRTVLIEDGCRGVNLHAGDVERALDEMQRAGAQIVASQTILQTG